MRQSGPPNAPKTPSFCFPLNFGDLEEEDIDAGDIISLPELLLLPDDPHNFGITCAPKKNTALDNGNPIKMAANKSGCKRFQTEIDGSFLPNLSLVDLNTLGPYEGEEPPRPPPQNEEPPPPNPFPSFEEERRLFRPFDSFASSSTFVKPSSKEELCRKE